MKKKNLIKFYLKYIDNESFSRYFKLKNESIIDLNRLDKLENKSR